MAKKPRRSPRTRNPPDVTQYSLRGIRSTLKAHEAYIRSLVRRVRALETAAQHSEVLRTFHQAMGLIPVSVAGSRIES